MNEVTNFLPDWVSPPGATIHDILEDRGQSVADLAAALMRSIEYARNLLEGGERINDEIASRLAQMFGTSVSFWLSRESQFRDGLARLEANEKWLMQIPVADLLKFDWIRSAYGTGDKIAACLEFFGVSNVSDWNERYLGGERLAAFRTSKVFQSEEGAVLTWLRMGEIKASFMDCGDWNPEGFQSALPFIRTLTRVKDPSVFIPKLQEHCSKFGVAVVIARAPSKCRASGATRFLSPHKALLMLSFRHLSDDHFWFTFFHEAGHLLLHQINSPFLEGVSLCSEKEESEANKFSSDLLIPPKYQASLHSLVWDRFSIARFAKQIGISSGIVVGQLQHLGIIPHNHFNGFKVRYQWD